MAIKIACTSSRSACLAVHFYHEKNSQTHVQAGKNCGIYRKISRKADKNTDHAGLSCC